MGKEGSGSDGTGDMGSGLNKGLGRGHAWHAREVLTAPLLVRCKV